jgi:hypothetical protein
MAKKQNVFKFGDSLTAFTDGDTAVISTNALNGNFGSDSVSDATITKSLKEPDPETEVFLPWGDDNQFPHNLVDKLGLLGVGQAALGNNADMHYGLGIKWWQDEYSDSGKRVSKLVKVDDWVRLERDTNLEIELSEVADSLEHFYIAFVQFMWNGAKTQINWVKCLNTPYVRFLRPGKDGKITKVRYSARFPDKPRENEYQDFNLYSFYHRNVDPRQFDSFVMPVFYGTWGSIDYPVPGYYSVFRNKWADIAISVPALINAIYTNFATLKYHIKIPKEYFFNKYKDWESKTEAEQLAIFRNEQDVMNKFLNGKENAGKAFITLFGIDENGNEIPGWVIEPIKNYLESTAELPNNSAANSEILFAMGVDPSLLGFGIPGGKELSGSGSDKRIARSNKVANLKRERLVSLQVAKMIGKLNGYYNKMPDIYPDYLSSDTSQTLDQNPTGSQTIKN